MTRGICCPWSKHDTSTARRRASSTGTATPWTARAASLRGRVRPAAHRERRAVASLDERETQAQAIGERGGYAQAAELYRHIVADRTRAAGAEDPATLKARRGLAFHLGATGATADAVDRLRKLVPVLTRVFGAEHAETLHARGYLAQLAGQAGDDAEALRLLREVVPAMTRSLGPEHPQTLSSRWRLAYHLGAADPARAARLLTELVPVMTEVLGPDHADTLNVRCLAACYLDDPDDTVRHLRAVIDDMTRALGDRAVGTLMARGDLARTIGAAGDPATALRLLHELHRITAETLGADDMDVRLIERDIATFREAVPSPADDERGPQQRRGTPADPADEPVG